jgi:hypothetical protein
MVDRRSFLSFGVSATAAAVAQTPAAPVAEEAAKPVSPFTDPDFGFTALIELGASYYRGGDPGKLLAILSHINPAISSPPGWPIMRPGWKHAPWPSRPPPSATP